MGNPDKFPGCKADPARDGSRLPMLKTTGMAFTLLFAMLVLFCDVNIAQSAGFVLKDGKRIEGEIIYASASSVVIRQSNGAPAQLGRHLIERVTLATGKNGDTVLAGKLKSWAKGVYEVSTDTGVYKVKARQIISQTQNSSDDIVVATAGKPKDAKNPEIVIATAGKPEEAKKLEITVATARETEEAKKLVFKFGLSRPVKQKVLLIYSTEDGTALAGFDYETKRGSIILQPGTTTASVSITLLDDDLKEGDETFELLVTSDLDLAAVKVKRGLATIVDNEAKTAEQ